MVLELLLATLLLGTGTPVARLVDEHLPLHLGSSVRMAAAVVVLGPVLVARREAVARLPRRVHVAAAFIAVVCLYGYTLAQVAALRITTGALCGLALGAGPLATALGAALFLREPVLPRHLVAAGLATAGLGFAQLDATGASTLTPWSALLLAALVAGLAAWTLVAKHASRDVDPLILTALVSVYALPLFAVPALRELHLLRAAPWTGIGWAIFWGAVEHALGMGLWYRVVARVPGTVAGSLSGAIAAGTLVMAALLLGEEMGPQHLGGLAMVLAGVAAVAHAPGGAGPRAHDTQDAGISSAEAPVDAATPTPSGPRGRP